MTTDTDPTACGHAREHKTCPDCGQGRDDCCVDCGCCADCGPCAPDYGTLMDSDTATEIGPATREQREASDAALPEGHFTIDEDGNVVLASEREQAVRTRGAVLRRVYVLPEG